MVRGFRNTLSDLIITSRKAVRFCMEGRGGRFASVRSFAIGTSVNNVVVRVMTSDAIPMFLTSSEFAISKTLTTHTDSRMSSPSVARVTGTLRPAACRSPLPVQKDNLLYVG